MDNRVYSTQSESFAVTPPAPVSREGKRAAVVAVEQEAMSAPWWRTLPRGRMRWPIVLQRLEQTPRPGANASWKIVKTPSHVAVLADSTIFLVCDFGLWWVHDARLAATHTPAMISFDFDEARTLAVAYRDGLIPQEEAFNKKGD